MKRIINKRCIFSSIIIVFILLAIFPFPWNQYIDDIFIDLQFNLRGSRQVSNDLVVVYIGDEDLKSLGGFPITRDYYSYVIHILNSMGAKAIALDILFSQKDKYHPEYDQTLIGFAKNYGNIILPMAFSELQPGDTLYKGINPIFPFEELKNSAAAIGFSNFAKSEKVQRAPLQVLYNNKIFYSFGLQIAKVYLNSDIDYITGQQGFIRLNHFGSIENVNTIGFVDLLQAYKKNPDSLNFEGKLVLVTVTAAGVSNFKSTPLDNVFPSSLIHLTVAENLIYKNYLVVVPSIVNLMIIVILAVGIWLFEFHFKSKYIFLSLIVLVCYWIGVMLLFSFANLVLPLFYPSLAIISLVVTSQIMTGREKIHLNSVIKDMLQTQLNKKENQLINTKEQLKKLNNQLKQESVSKEENLKQIQENKNLILKLEKEIRDLKSYKPSGSQEYVEIAEYENIIFSKDSKMAQVLDLVSKVVSNDIPLLILGETGTGKEMVANAIHKRSNRKHSPFIAVNCGALPETLLESELFGHEKGSFTGAVAMRKGKFELADAGIIFLDEISETSPSFQSRLLRVLQESTFERVGGEKSIKVNIRVIAATNKNLQDEIEQGRFRSDLFYRLNGFPITIPVLKERVEDIPLLAEHFLEKHGFNLSFSENSMRILQNYSWPGNVRELENIVHRSAIMASSANRKLITEEDLPDEIKSAHSNPILESIHKPLEEQILESMRTLKFSHSAISQTAKALGNKDRGTITEHFRGICFQHLVSSEFDISQAAQITAGTNDEEVLAAVKAKMNEYLNNLKSSIADSDLIDFEIISKGLPKKYHEYLKSVISYLSDKK